MLKLIDILLHYGFRERLQRIFKYGNIEDTGLTPEQKKIRDMDCDMCSHIHRLQTVKDGLVVMAYQ